MSENTPLFTFFAFQWFMIRLNIVSLLTRFSILHIACLCYLLGVVAYGCGRVWVWWCMGVVVCGYGGMWLWLHVGVVE